MSVTSKSFTISMDKLEISLNNKLYRFIWSVVYNLAFRYSPIPLFRWRILILRLFGANVSWSARVYPKVKIWSPRNLIVKSGVGIASEVVLYNVSIIEIAENTVISQYSHLCTASKTYWSEQRELISKPITIGSKVWIAADVFIGPGVVIGSNTTILARCTILENIMDNQIIKYGKSIKLPK